MKDDLTRDMEALDGRTKAEAASERIDVVLEGRDDNEALTDLLVDVMHWAKVSGHDFQAALSTAEMHFSFETDDDEG